MHDVRFEREPIVQKEWEGIEKGQLFPLYRRRRHPPTSG